MFNKRARPRPSVRSRVVDDDEPAPGSPLAKSSVVAGDADTTMDEEGSGAMSVMEKKKAQRKNKMLGKGSRLSFGGDDEGSDSAPFQQRKSRLSQASKLAHASPLAQSSTPVSTSSPSYSKEYLSELKATTSSRPPRSDADDDESGDGLSLLAQEKYASTLNDDATAGIPDAAAIAAAKQKRKTAVDKRRMGLESDEDYISLGGDKDGPHPESRLMREEDEGDEGDEDLADYTGANDRMYLGKKANKAAALRLKGEMGELIADREAESESDEETKAWEETVIGRAGTYVPEVKKAEKKRSVYRSKPIPVARPVPTISSAEGRIAQHMAKLKALKIENETTLETATRDLVLLEEQERDIRKQVEEVEGKREWVEGFQQWVEMLGSFLEEKMPKLEDIEKDQAKFGKERADIVRKRRKLDDADDLSLFLGVPTGSPEGAEVDESKPNSDSRRIRRIARDDRRSRRRGFGGAPAAHEGLSSDSELDDALADDYTAGQHDLERRAHALLEDVKAEDFRDPEKGIAVHFADWRTRYPEEYSGAFGRLALVQAWEFWARGEMIGWDPLRSDSTIDSFTWFTALYNYSRPPVENLDDDDMDLEPELGPDGDLATEMVSKAVVPLLIGAFEAGALDPYSGPQTRRAVDLVDFIGELIGKDSKKYTSLVKTAMGVYQTHIFKLTTEVAACAGPTAQRAPPYNPTARSAMQRYVRRRIKLLRNLAQWRRVAPAEVADLSARIISVVLRPALVRTWEGGGDDMAKEVLQSASGLPPNLVSFLQTGPQLR